MHVAGRSRQRAGLAGCWCATLIRTRFRCAKRSTCGRNSSRSAGSLASAATLLARRVEDGDMWRKGGVRVRGRAAGRAVGYVDQHGEAADRDVEAGQEAAEDRVRDAQGKLSPAKVEAIASAADVDPDAEDELLEGAETKPLAELREDCLKAKAKDRDKTHARIRRDRYAREYKDARRRVELLRPRDRSTTVHGSGPQWQPLIDGQFKLARAEDRHEPHRRLRVRRPHPARRSSPAPPRADPPTPTRPRRSRDPPTTKPAPKAKRTPAKVSRDHPPRLRGAGPRCGRG